MRGRKCFLLGIVLVLMLALTGCGDDSSDGSDGSSSNSEGGDGYADVSGTLTLPKASIGNTYTVIIDNDFDGGNGLVNTTSGILGDGTTQAYAIANVPMGTYYIYAAVYNAGSAGNAPIDGDFLGMYGASLASRPDSPNAYVPASGAVTRDITLQVYNSSGFGTPGSAIVNGTMSLPDAADGVTYWVALDEDVDGGNGWLYSASGTCGSSAS